MCCCCGCCCCRCCCCCFQRISHPRAKPQTLCFVFPPRGIFCPRCARTFILAYRFLRPRAHSVYFQLSGCLRRSHACAPALPISGCLPLYIPAPARLPCSLHRGRNAAGRSAGNRKMKGPAVYRLQGQIASATSTRRKTLGQTALIATLGSCYKYFATKRT